MAQKKHRGQRQRRTLAEKWQNLALAALAVLVIAGAGYALKGGSAASSGTADVPRPSPSVTKHAVASLWFGDSIVEGCCRSKATNPNMAETASKINGWAVPDVRGYGGTGYISTATVNGVTRATFPDNIGRALAEGTFDVVLVVGGNNDGDISARKDVFRAAVRQTLDQVRRAQPTAKVVVVGPYSPNGQGEADTRLIEQEEAARIGALWIDGIAEGWMRNHPELLYKDGYHPNDAGQLYLGRRLGADLKRLLHY